MCGILGRWSLTSPIKRNAFETQLSTLAVRGPDDAGVTFLCGDHVALGHRRLSVIDLTDAGRQPMTNEDQTIWLTFNGEIYNYKSLRDSLLASGHQFRSQSDSEVIIHGYEEWGDDVVTRLRGMFAFAIWDGQGERFLLARDQVGIKPLYYSINDQGLAFASQPRALLEGGDYPPSVNLESFSQYLAHRYVSCDRTIYVDISKLPPAHCLSFSLKQGVIIKKYWQLRYDPVITDLNEASIAIRNSLQNSVERHLVSDVPVGVLLSGGIDSSAITGFAKRSLDASFPAFVMGFSEPAYDERSFAKSMATSVDVLVDEQEMNFESFVERLSLHAELYDEPFFDYSGVFVYLLARNARRRDVRVVLCGDGADEMFAGYRWYEDACGLKDRSLISRAWQNFRPSTECGITDVYFRRVGFFSDADRQRLLPEKTGYQSNSLLKTFYRPDLPVVTSLQFLDFHTFLPDDILLKVDHATMACGVEARVPFLDLDVVETAFSIDHKLQFLAGERKSLLKKSLSGIVPNSLLSNRKKGFGAPIDQWMNTGLRRIALNLLTDGALVGSRLIRRDFGGISLNSMQGERLWLLLAAELWARRWLERCSADEISHCVRAAF